MSTLHDQLADLADDAPSGGPVPGLWEQGVRRRRRRQAARLGAVAAVVVAVATVATLLRPGAAEEPEPVRVPFGELHLPRTINAPDPWADGTEETGAPGPLAAVGQARRNHAVGLRGTEEELTAFGVSAVDGSALFLDLPDVGAEGAGNFQLALSPDGTKVGYVRYGDSGNEVVGFGVYDATTGRTRRLVDPGNPVIKGLDFFEITFSGDARYLETSYSLTGSDSSRAHSLVLWDVETGEQLVAEPAGAYWLPSMGSGPSGTVWSRGRKTFTFDPATSRTTSVSSDFEVVQASYGPDGKAFAAIAFGETEQADWRLFAGTSPAHVREIRLDIQPDELLGWRDAGHVVVRQLPDGRAVEVDLSTGDATDLRLRTDRGLLNLPRYAGGLWANPLVDGVRPPGASDPRRPWQAGGVTLLVVLAAGAVLRRRRARA